MARDLVIHLDDDAFYGSKPVAVYNIERVDTLLKELGFKSDRVPQSTVNEGLRLRGYIQPYAGDPPMVWFEPTDDRWKELAEKLDNCGITKAIFPRYDLSKPRKKHPLVAKYKEI